MFFYQIDKLISSSEINGLLIRSKNLFLQSQVLKFISDQEVDFKWFSDNFSDEELFKSFEEQKLLIYSNMDYNKRGINGLFFKAVQQVPFNYWNKNFCFKGKIILFGENKIINPTIRSKFIEWIV